MFLFADRGEGALVQAALIGAVTAMLVSGLLVIGFLDSPYRHGAGSLKSTAMEQALNQMDRLTTTLRLDMPDLCDATGHAHPAG